MNCEIYADVQDGKLITCGTVAHVKVIFMDGKIVPVCGECFYEQVTDGAVVGFILPDGFRVNFTFEQVDEYQS